MTSVYLHEPITKSSSILTENCVTSIFIIIFVTNELLDLAKAHFKRRTFHVPYFIPIWVDLNDTSSTVDSDVELVGLNSFSPCTMVYNAYQ